MGSCIVVYLFGAIEGIQPLEAGLLRRRVRRDRRPGMAIENPIMFYSKYSLRGLRLLFEAIRLLIPLAILRAQLKRDPASKHYMDEALTPVTDAEMDALALYQTSDAAASAVDAHRRKQSERTKRQAVGAGMRR
jgi:hypothetical protein